MSKISCNGTKALAAADVAAPRTECDLKTDVSTPAWAKKVRIQRATVAVVTARCGLMCEIKRMLGSLPDSRRRSLVADIYVLRHSTGHKVISFVKLEKKAVTVSSGRKVFVGVVRVKIAPSGASR